MFYCFTSSAPGVEGGRAYGPFGLFAALECSSDFHQAHEKLKPLGFGEVLAQKSGGATRNDRGPPDDHDETQLPAVTLPGGSTTITEAAARFGDLLAATGRVFRRRDSVFDLAHDQDGQPILRPIKPAAFASRMESVAKLVAFKKTKDGDLEEVPTTCSETTARLILSAGVFLNRLPPIHVVVPCPVLVERDGQLITITGYDLESGVLAAGEEPHDISIDEALTVLDEITAEFNYTSESDRARHFASLITPALVSGGLLGGRAPVDLTEANESQAGKGYGNKLTSAVYGMKLRTITQRKSGVGGIEESFSGALVSGAPIISLDNMRGKVDLPCLESFMTEDFFQARVPYSGDVEIDARRIVVMLTSNKAEITPDFANRAGIKRILKQPDGFQFRQYPEGDILDHVRANQPRYLGAVFAIIKAWHEAGKPRTNETRHDFRRWATTLDWIGKRPADHIGPMRHSGRQRLGSRLVRLAGSVVGRRRSTSRR